MKILAVEDDPTAGLMIEGILRSLGHDVILVNNARDAMRIQRAENIGIMVSDWQMQGTDGLDLCRAIRNSQKDYVYFILLTQNAHSEENERLAIEAGIDDFLTKPVRVHEMRSRLHVADRILKFTRQVQQLEEFLPICCYCKKIRDDDNYWDQIESYISRHTRSQFSHGVCPDCFQTQVIPQMESSGIDYPPAAKPTARRTPPSA